MSEPIIAVRKLGKRYRLGATLRHSTLRDQIAALLKGLGPRWRRPAPEARRDSDEFWALQDISFDVQPGEVLGIIGRNGAGKSTLLKLLSEITEPTTGEIRVRGRVASLLEVGTGFHPELSGRENVFMNGAILGMSKREIVAKFDEIVAFAGVEKFLDTPVKRYSSGMYVRLAFAVAAHLEPEILVVDEVLAVGDADFQKKCLGKMQDVAGHGRTVLFVSHNMGAVRTLCSRALVLEQGRIAHQGAVLEAVRHYVGAIHDGSLLRHYVCPEMRAGPHIRRVSIEQAELPPELPLAIDAPIAMRFDLELAGERNQVLNVAIFDSDGRCLVHVSDEFCAAELGACTWRVWTLPAYLLLEGRYLVDVALRPRRGRPGDRIQGTLGFEVVFTGKLAGATIRSDWTGFTGPGIGTWEGGL